LLLAWQELVDKIAEQRPEVAAILEHAVPLRIDTTIIHVAWPPGSTLDSQFTDAEFTRLLADSSTTAGSQIAIEITHDCREAAGHATLAAVETANRTRRVRELVQQSRQDPCILLAMEILGAHIREVRVPQDMK
jgi:hypothetical protein